MAQFDYKTMPLLKQNAASITGPGLLYPGQSGTYTITNYDDFHEWVVSTDKGTVSRVDDQITLEIAVGESSGVANIMVSRNGIRDSIQVMIAPSGVVAPVVLSPVNGAVDIVESPIITLSEFAAYPANFDIEQSVSVRIIDDEGGIAWQLLDQPPGTVFAVPAGVLSSGKTYRPQGRYRGTVLGYGEWSGLGGSFTTVGSFGPSGTGTLYEGDIVVGQMDGDWVIAAPATKRILAKWGLYNTDTSLVNITNTNTPDPNTGAQNTDVLVSASYNSIVDGDGVTGSPAAEYARSNGYDLPNKQEIAFIWDNRDTIDSADESGGANSFSAIRASQVGGGKQSIWTSSEKGLSEAITFSGGSDNGFTGYQWKYNVCWVIPVRRIPV